MTVPAVPLASTQTVFPAAARCAPASLDSSSATTADMCVRPGTITAVSRRSEATICSHLAAEGMCDMVTVSAYIPKQTRNGMRSAGIAIKRGYWNWLEGYLLTGRHGVFSCYEAFIHIVDSMFNQHAGQEAL